MASDPKRITGVSIGSVAVLLAIADQVSRAEYIGGFLPSALQRYLPVVYLVGFTSALFLIRSQRAQPRLVLAYEYRRPVHDPREASRPLIVINDGADTALDVRIEPAHLGEFEFRFSMRTNQLAVGGEATINTYSEYRLADKRTTSLEKVFTGLIEAKLAAGVNEGFTERLPVRIHFSDHEGREYAVRYDLVTGAYKRSEGGFSMEPIRAELSHDD